MIKEWSVANFKSIREAAKLALGPLTILAGANSSGKSSLIQSILMVSQTLSHKIDNRPVVLNGALADLGQFDDLKSVGGDSESITVSFRCEPLRAESGGPMKKLAITSKGPIYYGARNTGFGEIICEFSFDSARLDTDAGQSGHYRSYRQPRLLSTRLACSTRGNPARRSEITVNFRKDRENEMRGKFNRDDAEQWSQGLSYEVELDEDSNVEIKSEYMSASAKGCLMRHFLPRRIIYEINASLENANAVTQALQYGLPQVRDYRANVLPEPLLSADTLECIARGLKDIIDIREIFPVAAEAPGAGGQDGALTIRDWYEGLLALAPDRRIEVQQALREDDDLFARIYDSLNKQSHHKNALYIQDRPPEQITIASWYLDDFFSSSLRYLAPLRARPKTLYPQGNMADPTDIGIRGDNTAFILEIHKNKTISYIPSSAFAGPVIDQTPVKATLGEAVADWLRYLGIATMVESRDLGKVGHSLQVALDHSRDQRDLTHVGIGVSQVLPVLVLALIADSDATLVLEQPELHLHPKIQTLLADFFLSVAMADKQCIVETHSEHIVDRVRYRIASSGTGDGLGELSKLYFVERAAQSSTFREVKINDYGAIEDWPEGFFDESYHQATDILYAAQKKRLKQKR